MAEKKFSELTAKGATIADTDIVAISESAGGGTYTSKSVTGANIKALVTDANLTTTDVTTNNVSTSKHGFAPKAPNDGTKFLDGLGAYDTVKDSDLSLSDITTNDVSTTKHGFVPKAPNDTTKFLRGDGTWQVPAAGGLTKFTEAESTTSPNNTVYVDSLTAAGSTTNVDVAIVPKGTGAFMLDIPDNTSTGGNKRGSGAVDLQMSRGAASQVVSGANSFSAGSSNVVSGNNAIGLGNQISCTNDSTFGVGIASTASGYRANVIGSLSTASGSYSSCIGSNSTASSESSNVLGYSNLADGLISTTAIGEYASVQGISGRQAFAQRRISVTGDCQKSTFFFKLRTTDATATTLYTDANTFAAVSGKQINLANQSAYRFKGTIIGKQSGSTNAAAWDVDGLIVRGANAAATTLLISNVTLVQNTPAWGTPTLAADTTNGGLQVQVTGAAATNIQWTAVIETTEVIYA